MFKLVEELQIEQLPTDVPLEVHAYFEFDEAERNQEFELRVVTLHRDTEQRAASDAFPFMTPALRHRVRLRGLRFTSVGMCSVLVVELRGRNREPEAEWQDCALRWPLSVTIVPP